MYTYYACLARQHFDNADGAGVVGFVFVMAMWVLVGVALFGGSLSLG